MKSELCTVHAVARLKQFLHLIMSICFCFFLCVCFRTFRVLLLMWLLLLLLLMLGLSHAANTMAFVF